MREQVLVREGPVIGDAIERANAKVRRQKGRPMSRIQSSAASYACVHQGIDVRLRRVDGIVARHVTVVGIGMPLLLGNQFPFWTSARKTIAVRIVTLLQGND